MKTAFERAQVLNEEFSDLYGDSLKEYVQMASDATLGEIKAECSKNKAIGYENNIKVGERCIIAIFKYTWAGNVAKTKYLHIYHVADFKTRNVISHWREQKDGTFKLV